jgi:hypothetical protein
MKPRESFSVGDLRDPQPDDPRFATQQAAEQYAREQSFPERTLGDGVMTMVNCWR